jgi:hypothetical protein
MGIAFGMGIIVGLLIALLFATICVILYPSEDD